MSGKLEILLNNAFLNKNSTSNITKNYPDLNEDELGIFENFLKNCYKKINCRNKESWWTKASNSSKVNTDTAKYLEEKIIWHLHVNKDLKEDLSGKTIDYEIYPGKTAGYIICYYKEIINNCTYIHILLFAKHPSGTTWEEIEEHVSKVKYI